MPAGSLTCDQPGSATGLFNGLTATYERTRQTTSVHDNTPRYEPAFDLDAECATVAEKWSTAAGLDPKAIKCQHMDDIHADYADLLLLVDTSVVDCPTAAKALSRLAAAGGYTATEATWQQQNGTSSSAIAGEDLIQCHGGLDGTVAGDYTSNGIVIPFDGMRLEITAATHNWILTADNQNHQNWQTNQYHKMRRECNAVGDAFAAAVPGLGPEFIGCPVQIAPGSQRAYGDLFLCPLDTTELCVKHAYCPCSDSYAFAPSRGGNVHMKYPAEGFCDDDYDYSFSDFFNVAGKAVGFAKEECPNLCSAFQVCEDSEKVKHHHRVSRKYCNSGIHVFCLFWYFSGRRRHPLFDSMSFMIFFLFLLHGGVYRCASIGRVNVQRWRMLAV